jgi:class 3 adenylate cyclase
VSCGFESEAPFRFCSQCGTESATAEHEQRKTVTVLFCDLAGSTALGDGLDPERLRTLLARYFERMQAIVERHGGTIEKFIGDAVMAVFGVPVVREDDALRAVRAALEMRDALIDLALEGRIGVMTGEVVTGTEERLATGDAVNVAARLEQAAPPGEVLIGQPTLALVQAAVDVEPIAPLELKGKTEPVVAHRLVRVHDAPEWRHDTPFVGRERELALVREAWQRAKLEQHCELVTIVGEAGVGKSRLVAEFLASVDGAVVRGRCLPYGEGITYRAIVEVLKQIDLVPSDETAAAAIRALLGESEAATSPEEVAWAFRKTLEQVARQRPLVTVLDDIQWGDDILHNLIEHVGLLSSGAPILLLCMARPELAERRPTWPVTLRLEPLGAEDVETLLADRIPETMRDRIVRAAGGNPLFVEEMVAMARESKGEIVVPPTLQALLATRLDQLDAAERRVLERGSIEGEIFHRGAVQALAPDDTQITPRLAALVRKQLIRPDTPQLPAEDGFRFRHQLIRDAAYEALPKAVRAEFHERFAAWLDGHGTELAELDEIVGRHLERAHGYRAELGLDDDGQLAAAARRRLASAGYRAARRQDYGGTISLLQRAAALVPPTEVDLALENELLDALSWTGRGDEARRRAAALADRASTAGERIGELCGRIWAEELQLPLEPVDVTERLTTLVEQALPVFEDAGDDLALYIGYSALGWMADWQCRSDAALDAWERAFTYAVRAGHEPTWRLVTRSAGRFFGTTPLPELLEWLDGIEPRAGHNQFLRAYRANALAMLGRFDEARSILAEARAEQAERGGGTLLANLTAFESVWVELWAGNPGAAAEFGAEGFKLHEELDDQAFLSSSAAYLAQALYALDRVDEADTWACRAADLATSMSLHQFLWRQVRAKVLARRGAHVDAKRLAREAVAIGDMTEMLDGQGDLYADLGEVLLLAGEPAEAAAALEQALARFERKGNLVSAARMRARLRTLVLTG